MRKWFIAALILILTACSYSPQEFQINFVPQATVSSEKHVKNVMFSLTSKDMRAAQYVALIDSGQNNVYPVHAKQNVRTTLESVLLEQMQSQGYQYSSHSNYNLLLEVQHLLVDVKHHTMSHEMNAKVALQITAETPAGKLVKTYNGTASKTGSLSASESQVEQLINDVTNLVLVEIANDHELNNYMKEHF